MKDPIERQAIINELESWLKVEGYSEGELNIIKAVLYELQSLPSAQLEHTCVNCGRTVNNGGWYADGRTRCPIEEHYALPKDGYCHLWEKRNVTDDDYPERKMIEDAPSAQPGIIRCKDCIYYRQEIDMCDEPYSTAHNVVREDDYCSKAERRTDE